MTKRRKFIVGSALLSLGLLFLQYIPLDFRYVAIFGFFLLAYLISAWSLYEDLKGIEWITILSLPSIYSVGVGLFYYLLPDNLISRLVIVSLFGMGMYAIYLTENIYSVAASRTIQLLRAAHAVGFLMTVMTLVLIYNTIYSLKWAFWINGLLIVAATFPLLIQAFWSIKLKKRLHWELVLMALGLSLVVAEFGVILSFLPATVWIASLFLATVVYVILGLMQHALDERLFKRTIYEYLSVGILVFIATLWVTPWK